MAGNLESELQEVQQEQQIDSDSKDVENPRRRFFVDKVLSVTAFASGAILSLSFTNIINMANKEAISRSKNIRITSTKNERLLRYADNSVLYWLGSFLGVTQDTFSRFYKQYPDARIPRRSLFSILGNHFVITGASAIVLHQTLSAQEDKSSL